MAILIRRAYSMISRDTRPWTQAEDALLGTDFDRVIAAKLGRVTTAVTYRRKKLGIPHKKEQNERVAKDSA
jgi:hypothetical protein